MPDTLPWTLLGWLLVLVTLYWLALHVGVPAIRLAVKTYHRTRRFLRRYMAYRRTRDTPFAEGQRWSAGPDWYTVKRLVSPEWLVISHGSASWGETPDQFRRTIHRFRLFLYP